MFEDLLTGRKLNIDRLEPYGFIKEKDSWRFGTDIMDGEFALTVYVSETGDIDTSLKETATGEEYVLYKTNAAGAVLGEIRSQILEIVTDIVTACYEPAVFKNSQTEMLIRYVRERYGTDLEYLWPKTPENAIWRRRDNGKWYGIIMTVARGRVDGSDSAEMTEVVNMMMEKGERECLLGGKGYYPGWHMNKDSWFSVILDGSLPDEDITARLDKSFILAGGKNSYEKIYDVVKSIPEGRVATYGQVARLAGNPKWSRVVGYALHVNPEPGVIPCHRVVNSKGEPSRAFAFGGENRQISLLESEGVEFTDGHVDMGRFRWET